MRRLEIVTILRNEGLLDVEVAKLSAQKALFNMRNGRKTNPKASERQIESIKLSGSRVDELKELNIPTLIMHGSNDPLVLPEHGEKTAASIPGARLVWLEGMGHILTKQSTSKAVQEVVSHFRKNDKAL